MTTIILPAKFEQQFSEKLFDDIDARILLFLSSKKNPMFGPNILIEEPVSLTAESME
jgi:hypothetical protein